MGNCDHTTGECVCRDGWTGAACERLECDQGCSGNGRCLPMYRLAQLRQDNGELDPTVYGSTDLVRPFGTSVYASPETWDFDMMHGCLCDSGGRGGGNGAVDGDGLFYGGADRPRVGTRGHVSGLYTDNSKLSGWAGYACSKREFASGGGSGGCRHRKRSFRAKVAAGAVPVEAERVAEDSWARNRVFCVPVFCGGSVENLTSTFVCFR